TVTLPEDSCTDLDYCAYDNTFWIVSNPRKVVYKITPTGTVRRQFTVPQADYPCGIVEHDAEHKLYVSDRRMVGQTQQRVFVYDTLGNILDTLIHPITGNYGTRCLALDDRCPVNAPSVLNIFTWFNTGGTSIDSIGMLEIDRVSFALRNRFKFANSAWNVRGIEYDPRDGSYWVSIMEDQTGGNNRIFKVVGFNYGTGVEEKPVEVVGVGGDVLARPNPFTGSTVICAVPRAAGEVELRIFDGSGRLVHSTSQVAVKGRVAFNWNGRSGTGEVLSPGIYFYRLDGAGLKALGKLVLSR
ncbi:T9SS type A sorting domain-containing protein, partial [candidate division WOR-3 bacterium]|nr:T9SS type A sorting domain-containing protein [candidate division WOR-3 bacterium]